MVITEHVRSIVKPVEKLIDEFSVWVCKDIKSIKVKDEDGSTHVEYEYTETHFTKDEYISMIDDDTIILNNQLTNAELALCELYEELIGGSK